jgi:hypothetical protein
MCVLRIERGRRDVDRRATCRPEPDARTRQVEQLTVVVHGSTLPQRGDDIQRLVECPSPLSVRAIKLGVPVSDMVVGADAELEAPVREETDCCCLVGDGGGMAQRWEVDRSSKPDQLGGDGGSRERRQ